MDALQSHVNVRKVNAAVGGPGSGLDGNSSSLTMHHVDPRDLPTVGLDDPGLRGCNMLGACEAGVSIDGPLCFASFLACVVRLVGERDDDEERASSLPLRERYRALFCKEATKS